MQNAKHTPGPWQWNGYSLAPVIRDPDVSYTHTILQLENHGYSFVGKPLEKSLAEGDANLALIAASPDLLDALRMAEEFMSGFEDDDAQTGIGLKLTIIRDAISKATRPTDPKFGFCDTMIMENGEHIGWNMTDGTARYFADPSDRDALHHAAAFRPHPIQSDNPWAEMRAAISPEVDADFDRTVRQEGGAP